jgi:hypothetical protein
LIAFLISAICAISQIIIATSSIKNKLLKYIWSDLYSDNDEDLFFNNYRHLIYLYFVAILIPHGIFIYKYDSSMHWWSRLLLDAVILLFANFISNQKFQKNTISLKPIFNFVFKISVFYFFIFYFSFIGILLAYFFCSKSVFIEYTLIIGSSFVIIGTIYNVLNFYKIKE